MYVYICICALLSEAASVSRYPPILPSLSQVRQPKQLPQPGLGSAAGLQGGHHAGSEEEVTSAVWKLGDVAKDVPLMM